MSIVEETTVVDVDAHYSGQFAELVEYMEPGPYRERFRGAAEAIARGESGSVSKGFWPSTTGPNEFFRWRGYFEDDEAVDHPLSSTMEGPVGGEGKERIHNAMERLSIDKMVFLGGYMTNFGKLKGNDRRASVYANAYVDFLLDRIVDPGAGIYAVAPVPYQNPSEAAELIDRVGGERGIAAAVFISNRPEPPLGHQRYDVIYEAIQRAGIPAVFHGGTTGVDHFYDQGYSNRLETHHLSFLWSNMSQLTSILVQGVPVKFPDIDFVWQESGIFWIPGMMYRLDSEYLSRPELAPILEKLPSKYMKEMYYGTQPLDEPAHPSYFKDIIDMIGGPERLMYTSDWPHGDWDHPRVIEDIPGLTDEERAAILGKNAEEVFGI